MQHGWFSYSFISLKYMDLVRVPSNEEVSVRTVNDFYRHGLPQPQEGSLQTGLIDSKICLLSETKVTFSCIRASSS